MTPHRLCGLCRILVFALAAHSVANAGIRELLLPTRDLQTVTVTDMTPEGRLQRQPTAENPVYFVAVSGGYRDLGAPAVGEKPIPREVVNKTLMEVLAKQHYLPAKPGQAPDILVAWKWGTMNVDVITMGGSAAGMKIRLNEQQLIAFMGGYKADLSSRGETSPYTELAPGVSRGPTGQQIAEMAEDDLYVAQVIAFAPTLKDGKLVPLWNTRISCGARGFWMPDALPVAITMAGPMIGRETEKPVALRAVDVLKGRVDMDDLKVLEYDNSAKEAPPAK